MELLVRYDQMYATGSFVVLALAHRKTLLDSVSALCPSLRKLDRTHQAAGVVWKAPWSCSSKMKQAAVMAPRCRNPREDILMVPTHIGGQLVASMIVVGTNSGRVLREGPR